MEYLWKNQILTMKVKIIKNKKNQKKFEFLKKSKNDESRNNIPYYIMCCSNNSRCDHIYLYII